MRHSIVALAAAVLVPLVVPVSAQAAESDLRCFRQRAVERTLATKISSDRRRRGERGLRLDRQLSRVARRHAWTMASRSRLRLSPKRVLHRRVTRERVLGQNVGVASNVKQLKRALRSSPSYRRNLKNPRFRHVGVALVRRDGRVWFTAIFEARTDPNTTLSMCRKAPRTSDPEPTTEPTATEPTPDPTATEPVTEPTIDPDPIAPAPEPTVEPTAPPVVGDLSVTAPNSYSARISWTLPAGTTRARIFREGRLIDDVVVTGSLTYTDYLLWKSTTYRYEVRALGPGGALLASDSDGVTTRDQNSAFPRLYADDSFWNTKIQSSPKIDANSNAMVMKSLVGYKSSALLSKSDSWGMGLAFADPLSRRYDVGCTRYGCDRAVSARIPRYASASSGSDGKLIVIEPSTNTEFDAWIGEYDAAADTWRAGSRFLTRSDGWGALCGLGQRCNGPNAAGTAGMGGAVRPEEIAQGYIDHALAIATPYTRKDYIACPATHTDGKYDDVAALPQGARIQLDPSFDVAATAWPRWKKVVARALQEYGAYIDDTGGSLSIAAESNLNRGYDAWSRAGLTGSSSLADLPWERMRVLELQRC